MSDQQTKNPSTNEADQARAYNVSFMEWDVWGITLDALNEDDAIEIATQRWNESGADDVGFEFRNGGTDDWEAFRCPDDHLDD